MTTMTPKDFAAQVSSDGRTVRKFLRSITPKDEQPGKGSRWELPSTKRDITKLEKSFAGWSAKQAEEKAARAQKLSEEKAFAAIQAEDEDEDDEVLDEVEELDE